MHGFSGNSIHGFRIECTKGSVHKNGKSCEGKGFLLLLPAGQGNLRYTLLCKGERPALVPDEASQGIYPFYTGSFVLNWTSDRKYLYLLSIRFPRMFLWCLKYIYNPRKICGQKFFYFVSVSVPLFITFCGNSSKKQKDIQLIHNKVNFNFFFLRNTGKNP